MDDRLWSNGGRSIVGHGMLLSSDWCISTIGLGGDLSFDGGTDTVELSFCSVPSLFSEGLDLRGIRAHQELTTLCGMARVLVHLIGEYWHKLVVWTDIEVVRAAQYQDSLPPRSGVLVLFDPAGIELLELLLQLGVIGIELIDLLLQLVGRL